MSPKAPFSATSIVASFPSYAYDASPDPPVTLKRRNPQAVVKEGVASASALRDVDELEVKRMNVSKLISRHRYVSTCRAECDGTSFILKFVVGPERDPTPVFKLAMEAELYENQLVPVQGEAVPHYYGFFEGKDDQDWNVGCIVLEDCGDAMEGIFSDLPLTDRAKILTALGKVHKSGVSPMNFDESSVVHAKGDFRIMDFEDVYLKHVCAWTGELFAGEELPSPTEIGCGGIFDFGTEMELWELTDPWYNQSESD